MTQSSTDGPPGPWPAVAVQPWQDTRDTLHLWAQIVGKIRLELAPRVNHWWHSTLYVTATGLTTSLIPYHRSAFELSFDFPGGVLVLHTVEGKHREIRLEPRSVADFHTEVFARLAEVGVDVPILGRPVEVPVAIPFAEDEEHASYDADAVIRFWRSLVDATRVLTLFRSRFVGKSSPVHFFWGAFDLAVTRFSGRTAPRHPGGAPNCADWVMELAYSHEVSSAGYWPGGTEEGLFYSYAYPEPAGFREAPVEPEAASFDESLGEFVLPYRAVREAPDPDGALLTFLDSTYSVAAELGHWPRSSLELRP